MIQHASAPIDRWTHFVKSHGFGASNPAAQVLKSKPWVQVNLCVCSSDMKGTEVVLLREINRKDGSGMSRRSVFIKVMVKRK